MCFGSSSSKKNSSLPPRQVNVVSSRPAKASYGYKKYPKRGKHNGSGGDGGGDGGGGGGGDGGCGGGDGGGGGGGGE
ncbi:uncharacterized protein N7529_008052 [Penicillium soppii]|uniref:uncharacterized protein n=1 Tax=Penicillium soppii TaxID=69789 RepID=UPI002546CDFF|nr:uncharacterized protein N7529_008052 [Penicillium soppii]KAJ5860742.1 hypothetical protein N7529_008052 [Penicillium soppii]